MILVVYPTSAFSFFYPSPGCRIREVKKAPDPATLVSSKNGKRSKQDLESLSPPPPRPPNSELGFAPQNCFKGQTVQKVYGGTIDNDNIGTHTYQNHRSFLYVIHLPPLGFHCVGSWDGTQDCCDFGIGKSDALTTRLDLIHISLDLIHNLARYHPQLD
jgi:hypothetical protein